MKDLIYSEIVKLEPRILEAEALAQEHAASPTYGLWYRAVKPAFLPLVGILSKHADPRLRTSEAYDIVYRSLQAVYEGQPTDGVMPPSPSPTDQGTRICPACGQDMRDAESCGGPLIQVAGQVYERVRCGEVDDGPTLCFNRSSPSRFVTGSPFFFAATVPARSTPRTGSWRSTPARSRSA